MSTKTEIDPGTGGGGSPRKDVLRLHRLRWTDRSVAQALGISLHAVKSIIDAAEEEKQAAMKRRHA